MAKLMGEQGLSFEMKCVGPCHGWMKYELLFLWYGRSILDSAMLKHNIIMANQCLNKSWDTSDLVQVIRQALETGKPSKWEPLEPDVEITVHQVVHTDTFVFTISVDTRALEGCDSYTGDAVLLKMHVTRQALTHFCVTFEDEYLSAQARSL